MRLLAFLEWAAVVIGILAILAGLAVFGDRLGDNPLVIGVRVAAFALRFAKAAFGMGAKRWEAILRVIVPTAGGKETR